MHLEDKIYRRAQRETFKYRRQSEDTYIIAQGGRDAADGL